MVENPNGMSSEAIKNGTGRSWEEWVALLDAANAMSMNHTKLAKYIQAGTEEYFDSEKYRPRQRDWDAPGTSLTSKPTC